MDNPDGLDAAFNDEKIAAGGEFYIVDPAHWRGECIAAVRTARGRSSPCEDCDDTRRCSIAWCDVAHAIVQWISYHQGAGAVKTDVTQAYKRGLCGGTAIADRIGCGGTNSDGRPAHIGGNDSGFGIDPPNGLVATVTDVQVVL